MDVGYIEMYENVSHARTYMDKNYYLPLDLAQVSSRANFSRYHFIRVFRRVYRQTPHQYLMQKRINKAKVLLANSDMPITEICLAVGFQSLGSFSTLFYKRVGKSPKAYREKYLENKNTPQKPVPACYSFMFGIPQPKK